MIGNEKALEKKTRFTKSDLNRSAPGKIDSKIYEEKRASEILQMTNKYDFIIDIHGTVSNTGIFTIIPMPNIKNILFASLLPIKRNVFWYSMTSKDKGPITQFCNSPALEIECGPKNDPKIAKELEEIIINIIINMRSKNYNSIFKSISKKEFYTVYGSQKEFNLNLKDFKIFRANKEEFYPLLVNQYREIAFYKLKKINFHDIFLY